VSEKTTSDSPEGERLLHHEYDGIREYDNPMPRWWVWIFWATFWFSLAYLFHYWAGNGVSVADSYAGEMAVVREREAKAALAESVSEASLSTVMADTASLQAGGAVFQARCASCHLEKGQGLIGPNLTDDAWIHGHGSLLDIYATVNAGVLDKGMPAWGRQLSPLELRTVVAFVGSLRGTHVPGKEPQGSTAGGSATGGSTASGDAAPAQ
jgi:cytochrome c oxidase cbb3-type subunit III